MMSTEEEQSVMSGSNSELSIESDKDMSKLKPYKSLLSGNWNVEKSQKPNRNDVINSKKRTVEQCSTPENDSSSANIESRRKKRRKSVTVTSVVERRTTGISEKAIAKRRKKNRNKKLKKNVMNYLKGVIDLTEELGSSVPQQIDIQENFAGSKNNATTGRGPTKISPKGMKTRASAHFSNYVLLPSSIVIDDDPEVVKPASRGCKRKKSKQTLSVNETVKVVRKRASAHFSNYVSLPSIVIEDDDEHSCPEVVNPASSGSIRKKSKQSLNVNETITIDDSIVEVDSDATAVCGTLETTTSLNSKISSTVTNENVTGDGTSLAVRDKTGDVACSNVLRDFKENNSPQIASAEASPGMDSNTPNIVEEQVGDVKNSISSKETHQLKPFDNTAATDPSTTNSDIVILCEKKYLSPPSTMRKTSLYFRTPNKISNADIDNSIVFLDEVKNCNKTDLGVITEDIVVLCQKKNKSPMKVPNSPIVSALMVDTKSKADTNFKSNLVHIPVVPANNYVQQWMPKRHAPIHNLKESAIPVHLFGNNYSTPPVKPKYGLRPVVIDGSNVAMGHGRNKYFSSRGIQICVDFFLKKNHKVYAFVPLFRRSDPNTLDVHILNRLEASQHLIFTPSRNVNGRRIVPYDDRFILQTAAELGGVIVSKDNYRDLLLENPNYADVINNRLLMFTWVEDMIMFPPDPLGKYGPSLDRFLRF